MKRIKGKGFFCVFILCGILIAFVLFFPKGKNSEINEENTRESFVSGNINNSMDVKRADTLTSSSTEREGEVYVIQCELDGKLYNESIPTIEWIKLNGYPVNELGETYGPDISENVEDEPDLILVENDSGQKGYVKLIDLGDGVKSLEDAINHIPKEHAIKMYLNDGHTVIGNYVIVVGGKDEIY